MNTPTSTPGPRNQDFSMAGVVKPMTNKERRKSRHTCQWWLGNDRCRRYGWLRDWAGSTWCIYHSLYTWRWDGGERSFVWWLKHTTIIL